MTEAEITTSADEFKALADKVGADIFTNGLTTNSTLRHEEWERYDAKLLQIARQRLNGIADLQSNGLTFDVGGLGVMLSLYERVGDMTAAEINMDGMTDAQKDRVTFDQVGVPIPIFHKDWTLNKRQLLASRTRGEGLDVTQMAIATRLVMDSLEDCLFNGISNFTVDGKDIYGYRTHPNRNTEDLTDWTNAAARKIVEDVKKMLDKAYADNMFGPFTIYVSKNIWAEIQLDYNDQKGDRTYKERIEAFADISMVKPGDSMPADQVVMVQLTDDVVDLAVGQDIVNVEWQTHPMQSQFKVYGAMAPRVKADKDGHSGIVHGSW